MGNVVQPSVIDNIPDEVYQELQAIGVQSHLLGYDYLAYAISLAVNDIQVVNTMTKGIYPTVASAFGTTPSRAERAMRHAIDKVFDVVDTSVVYEYFGNTLDMNRLKATNTQFIATVARTVRRKMIKNVRSSEDNPE